MKVGEPTTIGDRDASAGPRLSEELTALAGRLADEPVTVRQLVSVLRGRAYVLLLLAFALPFCTPIPLPGLSTPFGAVIALVGARLSLGREPWLPARLLDTTVPPPFFGRVLAAARRLIRVLEWVLKPRWATLVEVEAMRRICGVVIAVSGLLLLLPLPVPFSNFFPSFTVVLTAAALLERDGVVAVAALATFGVTLGFFAALAWGGVEGIQAIRRLAG